jgi:tRNA (cmo5U34)-methyltransferase
MTPAPAVKASFAMSPSNEKDKLYRKKRSAVVPFAFDDAVASVFDDMIHRSVPGYAEVIKQQARLAAGNYIPGTRIYDLGCSSGNLALAMAAEPALKNAIVCAVDNSLPMLKVFVERTVPGRRTLHLHPLCMDICDVPVKNASVVVVNYTLQFIAPQARDALLAGIYRGVVPGGILLVAEKTVHSDPDMARLEQDFYFRFKKENGYSQLEISQKRDALENVLIPDSRETHLSRLTDVGFESVAVWFQWFNFSAFLARKGK